MRQFGKLAAYSSLVVLTFAAACPRPASGPDSSGTRTDPRQLPFDDGSQDEAGSSTQKLSGDADNSSDSGRELPFLDSQNLDSHRLPVGTLLTVRLNRPISAGPNSAGADAPKSFEAIVDEPVVVEGNTIIAAGSHVTGFIGSARKSALNRDRGYVQLTLSHIDINGRSLRVRTSSLFARVSTSPALSPVASDSISLDQGRRLTFRLTAPLALGGSHTR